MADKKVSKSPPMGLLGAMSRYSASLSNTLTNKGVKEPRWLNKFVLHGTKWMALLLTLSLPVLLPITWFLVIYYAYIALTACDLSLMIVTGLFAWIMLGIRFQHKE